MAAMRVHELAKELGMSSKDLLDKLEEMKIPAKNHASTLVDAYVDKVKKELGPQVEKQPSGDRTAQRIAEAEAKAKADAERKKAEEQRRAAAEAERKARAEELARREEEARKEREEKQETEPSQVAEEAPAEETSSPQATASASAFDSLLSQIAAENDRLTSSRTQEAQAPAADTSQEGAGKGAKRQAQPAKQKQPEEPQIPDIVFDQNAGKTKKGGRKDARDDVYAVSEDDRYRQMAETAEQYQRDKVLEEARAAAAASEGRSSGRRQKRKEKRAAEKAAQEAAEAERKAAETGIAVGVVQVTSGVTVGELADLLEVPGNEIVKRLLLLGTPLTLTQTMSDDLVELVAGDLGREVKIISQDEEMSFTFHDDPEDLQPRPPVVTVMGHVDHGKTSLLDAIRKTGVAEQEAGGITQHIGASVVYSNGRQITFVDTPGHEAFTAMRARGAKVTDIVVLVVAADDGVMPQTIEAIDHARAAEVPIIVAVNKIDKDGANPERVRTELSEHGVICEEWGGENMFVEVSAKQGTNIDELLETIILQADVLELKANPNAPASGFVIEANLDKGRGSVATVIVQRGTLHVGDALVAGTCYGRVRALINPKGENVEEAKPSDPVEILGLNAVPSAGDEFCVFEEESEARKLAEQRALKQRMAAQETQAHVSLDDLFERIEQDKLAELNLVVKADVQGSIEALRDALDKMDQSEVRINVIHSAVGAITETDVTFAAASEAIIIGFNVRPQAKAREAAEREKVDIRTYQVIYQAIDDINAARVGLLEPEEVSVDTGAAEVRELFKVPAGVIAGCTVTDGDIKNTDRIRVVRDGVVVHDGPISSMRHYKDDVEEIHAGSECGIGVEDYQDIKVGDVLEAYRIEQVARKE